VRPFRVRGVKKTFHWQRDASTSQALVIHKDGYGPQTGEIRVTLAGPDGRAVFERKGVDRALEDWACLVPPRPDLPSGVLRLDVLSAGGGCWDVEPATERVVLDVRDWLVLGKGGRGPGGARRFYFRVPQGTGEFAVVLKGWKPGRVVACLLGPDGTVVAHLTFDAGKPGETDKERRLSARPRPDQQDKMWSFAISFPDDIHFRIEGVPPFFALRPDSWFNPE
jgi:hypothetical protein